MPRKNLIWCEVTCGRCGTAANNCGYYSPDLIKRLKQETKNWTEDLDYRILCPTCQREKPTRKTSSARINM